MAFSSNTTENTNFNIYNRFSNEIRQFICRICFKTFIEENQLHIHQNYHSLIQNNIKETLNDSRRLNCDYCDKTFRGKAVLDSHILKHQADSDINCVRDSANSDDRIKVEESLGTSSDKDSNIKSLTPEFKPREALNEKISNNDDCFEKLVLFKKHFLSKDGLIHSDNEFLSLQSKINNSENGLDIENRLKCKVCGETFLEYRDLLTHNNSVHPEIYRKTRIDLSKNKKIAHIILEVKENREERNQENKNIRVNCEICGRLVRRIRYKAHIKSHTEPVKHEKIIRVACEICGKRVKNVSYRSHLKTHEEKIFKCNICGQTFTLREEYESHINNLHPGALQPKKKAVCELCGKDFTATSLYAHVKICQTTKLKCDTCRRTFIGEKELKSHVCKHFSCDICDQQFMFVRNLELHKLEHDGEEFFHCDFCEELYRTRKQYFAHRRESHTNPREKNHKCEKCSKDFINARQLRKHYRVHSNDRPFKCDACDAAFKAKFNLKIHMKTHGGEKLYSCDMCGKKFLNVGNMKHHKESKKCVNFSDEVKMGSSTK